MKQDPTQLKEKSGIKGILTFRNFVIEHPRAKEIDLFLRNHSTLLDRRLYQSLLAELAALCTVREFKTHNLVVDTGLAALAAALANESGAAISFGALGTDNTAVNAADTELGAEVARKGVARRERTDNVLVLDFYYSQLDTTGTYEEFGTFIGGSVDTPDSGTLFNRALTGGWTKTSSEAMTVSLEITIDTP